MGLPWKGKRGDGKVSRSGVGVCALFSAVHIMFDG